MRTGCLRKIFGPKRDGVTGDGRKLYVYVIKSILARLVARMG